MPHSKEKDSKPSEDLVDEILARIQDRRLSGGSRNSMPSGPDYPEPSSVRLEGESAAGGVAETGVERARRAAQRERMDRRHQGIPGSFNPPASPSEPVPRSFNPPASSSEPAPRNFNPPASMSEPAPRSFNPRPSMSEPAPLSPEEQAAYEVRRREHAEREQLNYLLSKWAGMGGQ